MFDPYFQITPIKTSDLKLVSDFISSSPYYFRHLDWHLPSDWIGTQPFLMCSYMARPTAMIICPYQNDGAIWLRCFAAQAFHSMKPAWKHLLSATRADLVARNAKAIYSISLTDWYEDLLLSESFQKVNEIVVLELLLDQSLAESQFPDSGMFLRQMNLADLPEVFNLDRVCFAPLWQMNLKDLTTAFTVSQNCTILHTPAGEIIGYQISNYLPAGGHLARIAVHPDFQGQGLSKSLLSDLLYRFQQTGINRITVNTQADNQISIHLYRQFGFTKIEEAYPVFRMDL